MWRRKNGSDGTMRHYAPSGTGRALCGRLSAQGWGEATLKGKSCGFCVGYMKTVLFHAGDDSGPACMCEICRYARDVAAE